MIAALDPALIGVSLAKTTVLDKSIVPGTTSNLDSFSKYNPLGPDLSVLITYVPNLVTVTVYFLYPVVVSAWEVKSFNKSKLLPSINDTLRSRSFSIVSAKLLYLSNDLTSNEYDYQHFHQLNSQVFYHLYSIFLIFEF